MAEPVAYGLIGDPSLTRAALIPVGRRTYTDPGDDITEELGGLELATPGLLHDPLMGMAQTGAMLMGDMPVNPNVMTQTMLDAPLIGGLLGAATGAAPKGTLLGANVFHGGPHRFAAEPDFPHGRPRLDKIGTGEGAQAYGYGFYSAESEGVARHYASKLGSGQTWLVDEGVVTPSGNKDPIDFAVETLAKGLSGEKRAEVEKAVRTAFSGMSRTELQDTLQRHILPKAREGLPRERWSDYRLPYSESLYKLDIPDADVAKYLDYDKPLSQQAPYVKQRVEKLIDDIGGDFANEFSHPQTRVTTTGERLYNLLQRRLGLSDKEASEALREAGIPGLKYFDGMSRDGGEGTRNYVTWDQDVLDRSKMLERDGVTLGANKAPTAALPGLLGKTSSELRAEANALRFPNEDLNINAELAQSAKDYFGVTRSPNETGYIMQDGTRLDLSGRHYASGYEKKGDRFVPKAGETDYLGGDRAIDHRELYDLKGIDDAGWSAVEKLMRETGAVRYKPNTGFSIIDGQKVSDKQLKAIVSDFRKNGNSLTVDIDPIGGNSAPKSKTFDRPTVEGVREFIELGANKAPTAALPGLLDDTASRMQRARDMGFDVDNPVYHGTPDVRPINEMGFATPSELLLKKPQRGPYFFSKDRPTAATYADDRRAFDYQNAKPEVIKAFIKQENPLVIDAKGATYDGIDADKIIKQFADSPDKETVVRQVKKYAAIMNGKVNSDQLAGLAARLGRDGVVIKNVRDTYEGKGKPTDVFMVLGAENIRRTTAKFDPTKADSADLLAANPATAALPGLLQDRRRKPGRTPRKRDEFPIFGLLGQRLYTATAPDGSI